MPDPRRSTPACAPARLTDFAALDSLGLAPLPESTWALLKGSMSEAHVSAAIEVDVDDDEVLSLLEGHDTHDISGAVSLMTESSLRSTVPPDEDLGSVIAGATTSGGEDLLDPVSQTGGSLHHHSDFQDDPVTVSSRPPDVTLENHLPDSRDPTGMEKSGKSISVPPTPDIAMSSTSPQSICLCQAPTRIPRPRNGKTSLQNPYRMHRI